VGWRWRFVERLNKTGENGSPCATPRQVDSSVLEEFFDRPGMQVGLIDFYKVGGS